METISQKIALFIQEHHVLSLATYGDELSCCSLFYAYDANDNAFIVATDTQTFHGTNVIKNPFVAGTVALETMKIGKIQGIQFRGEMMHYPDGAEHYFDVFPYARLMSPMLWKIRLDEIKLTDNRLGFGKKLSWKRSF